MACHTKRSRDLSITAALLFIAATADARQITLAWDAVAEPSIAGYVVSYGPQSREVIAYPNSVDVGNLLSVQLNLPGDQYFFAVRAYDTEGKLSDFSLEVADALGVALSNPGDQFLSAGERVSLQLFARGVPVAYGASNLPPGLSIDSTTGRVFHPFAAFNK